MKVSIEGHKCVKPDVKTPHIIPPEPEPEPEPEPDTDIDTEPEPDTDIDTEPEPEHPELEFDMI